MSSLRGALKVVLDRYLWVTTAVALNVPVVLLVLLRDLRGTPVNWMTGFYAGLAVIGDYLLPFFLVGALLFLLLAPWRRAAAVAFDDNGLGYRGDGSNFTRSQTMVPMIIYFPDRPPRRIQEVTSHLDVPPTLLRHYLGCPNDVRAYSDGLDLCGQLPELRPLVISCYFNHAFIIGDDVFAVLPLSMRGYKLDSISRPAAAPDPRQLRVIMRDISRFHGGDGGVRLLEGT